GQAVHAPVEVREFPGSTRERAAPEPRHKIELAVAARDVVAPPRAVDPDGAVDRQRAEVRGLYIDDPGADLDLRDVRGRDRAEVPRGARVRRRRARLRHMKISASREGR